MKGQKTKEDILLTKYEVAHLVGARALQIAMGAPFKIKLSDTDLEKIQYNPIRIAQLEMEQGLIPLEIVRPKVTLTEEENRKIEGEAVQPTKKAEEHL